MSLKLVQALHDALSRLAIERDGKDIDGEASVLAQFKAGDYAAVKKALAEAKADLGWSEKHAIADAAGIPSHEQSGGAIPADLRVDMAAETLPDAAPQQDAEVAPAAEPATTVEGELPPQEQP